MFDRLQTALLVCLVISSLILTAHLWLAPAGEAQESLPGYSPPVPDTPPPALSSLLRPQAIVLYGEDAAGVWQWTLRPGDPNYATLWEAGKLLQRVLAGRRLSAPPPVTTGAQLGLRLLFDVDLELRHWAHVFSVEGAAGLPAVMTREFHVYVDGDQAVLEARGPSGSAAFGLQAAWGPSLRTLLTGVRQSLDENEATPRWEYQPPEAFTTVELKTGVLVPLVPLAPYFAYLESYEAQELVEAIFFEPSFPRRIEERDGSVIYTDDRRGLRIYPQGGWEYTSPLGGAAEIHDELDALAAASRFAHLHGGIARDMRIIQLAREWTVRGPLWVVGLSQDVAGISVTGPPAPVWVRVGQHGVEGYQRSLAFAAGTAGAAGAVISPEAAFLALRDGLGLPGERYEGTLVVDAVTLFYRRPAREPEPVVLTPVWVLRLGDGRMATVDAYHGELWLHW